MNYQFNVEIANKIGVEEAIVFENLIFWIKKNKANNKHLHDGKYWTYNSTKAFAELFPFWTEAQIKRILKSLITQEVIIVDCFNENKYDRTNWYSLSNGYYHFIDWSESANGKNEVSQSLIKTDNKPFINTDIKPYIKEKSEKPSFVFDDFSEIEKNAIKTWLEYKSDNKQSFKSQHGYTSLRNELLELRKTNSIVECINFAMAKNWKGIFAINKPQQSTAQLLHRCNSNDYSEEF